MHIFEVISLEVNIIANLAKQNVLRSQGNLKTLLKLNTTILIQ